MNALHFGVVVGIDAYSSITKLTAARHDAGDFYRWLTDKEGGALPPENVTLIRWELPENATEAEIEPTRDAVFEALRSRKNQARELLKEDPLRFQQLRFYFYAAGHGVAPDPRDAALLASNASRDDYGRHISCTSLLTFFGEVQYFREVVMFADCCRNTVVRRIPRMPVEWSDDAVDRGGVRTFVGFGATYNRLAREEDEGAPDDRRGYFSRALMDALRHGATPQSPVTGTRLKTLIADHMTANSKGKFRPPLEPDFIDQGTPEILFGQPAPATVFPVRVKVRDPQVTGLLIVPDKQPESAGIPATPVAGAPQLFACELPRDTYEAIPQGIPRSTGQPWLFRVGEGGGSFEF